MDKYLLFAERLARRGTCIRRNYGAVIVKDNKYISSGYTTVPTGSKKCSNNTCVRKLNNIPHGERYELCKSVHAEENAIISASKKQLQGSTLYLNGIDSETGKLLKDPLPCILCMKSIIQSGIKEIITPNRKILKNNFVDIYTILK